MKVLVTGAAGYIGSVVTEELVSQDHQVIALDNLKQGYQAAIHPAARFVRGDLLDAEFLRALVLAHPVDAVIHLAAEALVEESVKDPGLFFRVNVVGGLNLLDVMRAGGVKRIVFSSTAAVYGEPQTLPIPEESPCVPVNSYGESKLACERMLEWYRRAYGINYVTFRYFNAAGATERCGEFHVPETHLIPILLQVALGEREVFHLYGTDYDTPDGTCIRDYIHVADIARAHVLALGEMDRLEARIYNIGNGAGYSNQQVVEAVRQVTGREIRVVASARRPGDPARLVASSEKISRELKWKPQSPNLEDMIESAWAWLQRHPQGYET